MSAIVRFTSHFGFQSLKQALVCISFPNTHNFFNRQTPPFTLKPKNGTEFPFDMMSACFPIVRAGVADRENLREFHVSNHLKATVYSPESHAAQLDDLPTDFPHLYSDEVFEKSIILVMKNTDTNEVVAMLALEPHDGDPIIELKSFSVAETCRRQGVGQRMLQHAIDTCRSLGYKGIKLLTLDVLPDARRLYERNGFRIVREEVVPHYRLYYYQLDLE